MSAPVVAPVVAQKEPVSAMSAPAAAKPGYWRVAQVLVRGLFFLLAYGIVRPRIPPLYVNEAL